VIVDDLYVVSIAPFPIETDAPLVIDPDTMLTLPISFESLQAIRRWHAEVSQGLCPIDHPELSQGTPLDVRRKPPNRPSVEESSGIS